MGQRMFFYDMEQGVDEELIVYGRRLLEQANLCEFSGDVMSIVAGHMAVMCKHEPAPNAEELYKTLVSDLAERVEYDLNAVVQEMADIDLEM